MSDNHDNLVKLKMKNIFFADKYFEQDMTYSKIKFLKFDNVTFNTSSEEKKNQFLQKMPLLEKLIINSSNDFEISLLKDLSKSLIKLSLTKNGFVDYDFENIMTNYLVASESIRKNLLYLSFGDNYISNVNLSDTIPVNIVKWAKLEKIMNNLLSGFEAWEQRNAELVNRFFDQPYFKWEESLINKLVEIKPNIKFDDIKCEWINLALLMNTNWMWDFKVCMDKIENNRPFTFKKKFKEKVWYFNSKLIWNLNDKDNFLRHNNNGKNGKRIEQTGNRFETKTFELTDK